MKDQSYLDAISRFSFLKPATDASFLYRYGVAAISVLVIALARGFLQLILDGRVPYTAFLIAISFSAWYLGLRPSLFSLGMSILIANFLFVEPYIALGIFSIGELFALLIFLSVSSFIIVLSELQRQRNRELEMEIQRRVQSEERFQLATTAFDGVVYDWDGTQNYTWRSAGLKRLLGYDTDEIPTRPDWWQAQIHPDDRERVQQNFEKLIAQKSSLQIEEYRVRHKQGHYVWVWDNSSVVYDADGHFVRVSGLTLNIDAQKRAEAHSQVLLTFAIQLSQAITTTQVADIISRVALEATGGSYSGVYALSANKQMLERLSSIDISETVLSQFPKIPLDGQFPLAEAVRERKILWIETVDAYIQRYPLLEAEIKQLHAQSFIYLPFFANEDVLGGMHIAFDHSKPVEPELRNFLFLLAQLCSQALQRTALYEAAQTAQVQAERKTARIEALQSITTRLSAAATPHEVIQVISNQAFRALGAHIGALAFINDDHSGIDIVAQSSVSQEILDQYRYIPFTTPTPISDCASSGKAIWILSLEEYETLYPEIPKSLHLQTGTQAIACLPLADNGKIIGSIGMSFPSPQTFSAEDRNFISTLSQQCAQAIVRAKLYEQAQNLAALQERQRIARELHDGVSQSIFSANILIEALPRWLEHKPKQALEQVEEIRHLIEGIGAEMRMLLFEFRPENILKAKLDDLLTQLAHTLQARQRIAVSVNIIGQRDKAFPERVHLTLYRITQESLNNVLKHGNATNVRVKLRYIPNQVELTIVDNGNGFDTKVISPGFGLTSMRERAYSIGASLRIQSKVGIGTRIKLVWKTENEV